MGSRQAVIRSSESHQSDFRQSSDGSRQSLGSQIAMRMHLMRSFETESFFSLVIDRITPQI